MEKTKKEHYVPRCYLNRWGNNTYQVNVFDKKNNKNWKSSIYDVACERYFYDMKYEGLDKSILDFFHENGIKPEEDEQFIEHFFSEQIETEYGALLQEIVDKETTPWYENNCYFISKEKKLKFAVCLAYQFIRTKEIRNVISGVSRCVEEWITDMGFNQDTVKKYTINSGEESDIHKDMICDFNHIVDFTKTLFGLSWILRINRTDKLLYTSDNPIGTYPHCKHPYISMAGISSEGVEVYLPLSPKCILVMYDGDYHTELKKFDRRYVEINDQEDIDWYNYRCIANCSQFIISSTNEAETIRRIIAENPDLTKADKVSLSYGGKRY